MILAPQLAFRRLAPRATRIAVIGDAGIDRWFRCVRRSNPEGEWPVVERMEGPWESAGMASAVAMMCQALGAETRLVCRPCSPLMHSIKSRFVAEGVFEQIVFRGDWDPPPIDLAQRRVIQNAAVEAARWADAVAISDYGKGVVHQELVRQVLDAARGPVLVDPARGRDWSLFEGCWAIKAPRACWQAQSGAVRSKFPRQVITDGPAGLDCVDAEGRAHVAAYTHGMFCDAIGAGDQVLAVLAVESAGAEPPPLVAVGELAAIAAGILCTRRGAAPTHRYEIAGVLEDRAAAT